jgi:hypothetical protein
MGPRTHRPAHHPQPPAVPRRLDAEEEEEGRR